MNNGDVQTMSSLDLWNNFALLTAEKLIFHFFWQIIQIVC